MADKKQKEKLEAAILYINKQIEQVKRSNLEMIKKTQMIGVLVKQKEKLKDALFDKKAS